MLNAVNYEQEVSVLVSVAGDFFLNAIDNVFEDKILQLNHLSERSV